MNRAKEIKDFIMRNVVSHENDIIIYTAEHFAITRTATLRHMHSLIQNNKIVRTGYTKDVKYFLAKQLNQSFSHKITKSLDEFSVWEKHLKLAFLAIPKDVTDIVHYGFSEIFNNAIDHSEGTIIKVNVEMQGRDIVLTIQDNGIGIFKKVRDSFLLDDLRESILQLSIGKLTTDPKNHSGEGIFFTSRAFDRYEIYANGLHYIRDNLENDWSLEHEDHFNKKGTKLVMRISRKSTKSLTFIFRKFEDLDTLAFDRTEILVELSKFGEETFISRSQAKRITRNLDKFRHVTLDFTGVRLVGQGFVDQIFRVYANEHPDIKIVYINANMDVDYMIKRTLASSDS
jgi:anti-sigma regulatory factor (Ser/Thr protein kinase)